MVSGHRETPVESGAGIEVDLKVEDPHVPVHTVSFEKRVNSRYLSA